MNETAHQRHLQGNGSGVDPVRAVRGRGVGQRVVVLLVGLLTLTAGSATFAQSPSAVPEGSGLVVESPGPIAEPEQRPPVAIKGRIACDEPDYSSQPFFRNEPAERWAHHLLSWVQPLETRGMSDPRFAGVGTMTTISEDYVADFEKRWASLKKPMRPSAGVSTKTYRIENANGAWEGTIFGVHSFLVDRQASRKASPSLFINSPAQMVFVGEGEYAGLVAFVELSLTKRPHYGCSSKVRGVILDRPWLLEVVPDLG
jgi:hypothetical protein